MTNLITFFMASFWALFAGSNYDENSDDSEKSNQLLLELIQVKKGEDCLNGGVLGLTGFDLNNNNKLDDNEITNQVFICNDRDGADEDKGENGDINDKGNKGYNRSYSQKPAAETEKIKITAENIDSLNYKLNYAIAYDIGRSITRNQLGYNEAIFSKGLDDGMKDETDSDNALMNEEERIQVKREHSMQMRDREKKERDEAGKANKEAAEKFLAKNKGKKGIVVTQSGLQYKILTETDGFKPTIEDTVKVHFKGTLLDGTEFDNSHKRGEPATFPVGRVVRGWTEALQLMPVGSKWQLFIPPDLGYGEKGAGSKIGPNTLLIFEVELLEITNHE